MHTGLVFTCPKNLLPLIPTLFLDRGIAIEGRASDNSTPLSPEFVCRKQGQKLRISAISRPEFPLVVQIILEVPPVARQCNLLAEIITLLREKGSLDGPPDEVRCPCGYSLMHNTSGRCPECGKIIGTGNFA